MKLADKQRYFTPTVILDKIAEQWPQGISLDPCWDPECYVQAQVTFDARLGQDGLSLPWTVPNPTPTPGREPWRDHVLAPTLFANPPYEKPSQWTIRAVQHTIADPTTQVIMLLNLAAGTDYWHDHVWPFASVCLVKGRLRFGRPGGAKPTPSPHESAIIYWGPNHSRFREVWRTVGRVVQPELAVAA